MKNIYLVVTIFIVSIISLLFLPKQENLQSDKPNNGENLSINNINYFDGSNWKKAEKIWITQGKFYTSKPVNWTDNTDNEINGKDLFLIPGLIDHHTHNWDNALQEALSFGVTTQVDMFTHIDFLKAQKKSLSKNNIQASFYSAGTLATSSKGHGTEYGFTIPTIDSADMAEQFVKERVSEGSDFIKIVYHHESPYYGHFTSIDKPTLKALITAAHKFNKKAVVHISSLQGAKEAVLAGADGLVHIFHDQLADEEIINLMLKHKVFVIPTLSVIQSFAEQMDHSFILQNGLIDKNVSKTQKQAWDQVLLPQVNQSSKHVNIFTTALENTQRLYQAGIPVLAGTDAGNPNVLHGASIHNELYLMSLANIPADKILQSATMMSQLFLDEQFLGQLIDGAPANMLLLSKDPQTDIRHSQAIKTIFKNGIAFNPKAEEQASNSWGHKLLSDFENNSLTTEQALSFVATSDSMMNGNSKAEVLLTDNTCDGQFGLRVSGEIKPGFPFPWSGALVSFSKDWSKSVSLNSHRSLSFSVKGSEGDYRLMVFIAKTQRPVEIPFTISQSCSNVDIAFSEYPTIDWSQVQAFAWVANKTSNSFEFVLDSIQLN